MCCIGSTRVWHSKLDLEESWWLQVDQNLVDIKIYSKLNQQGKIRILLSGAEVIGCRIWLPGILLGTPAEGDIALDTMGMPSSTKQRRLVVMLLEKFSLYVVCFEHQFIAILSLFWVACKGWAKMWQMRLLLLPGTLKLTVLAIY